MSLRRTGFMARSVYRYRQPKLFTVAREKLSFTIAIFTVTAFVLGNMVGQHGWYAFWKTVLGEGSDATIVFDGMVTPVEFVPDYRRWADYGGSSEEHTFASVPRDLLIPLPVYRASELQNLENIPNADRSIAQLVYSMGHMSSYENGNDSGGSHVGIDIRLPVGTPVRSIAHGIVDKVTVQSGGFGQYIVVRYPNVPDRTAVGGTATYYATYAHLSAMLVREGQVVTKGEVIGRSGKTGFVTGAHLHFQVDGESAPYHPYWPFTSSEAASANMTFVSAVNAGLNKDQAKLHTVSPILLVQTYQSYQTPVLATSGNAALNGVVAQSVSSSVRSLTVSERLRSSAKSRVSLRKSAAVARSARIASRITSSRTPVTVASLQSVVAQYGATASFEGTSNDVARIELSHSGKVETGWQTVTLRAVDRDGKIVKNPTFLGKLYVRPEFGDAEIRPDTLTSSQFVNGIATVEVLARGQKTVYFVTRGAYESQSAPLIADR